MLRRSARRALTPWRRQSIRIADRVRFPPQSRHNALPSGQPAAPLLWRQAMADDRFPSRFAANASLLPHIADLANDRVLIALLGEADYRAARSEEHTSELQSLMRISYAVFCLKKKNTLTHKLT